MFSRLITYIIKISWLVKLFQSLLFAQSWVITVWNSWTFAVIPHSRCTECYIYKVSNQASAIFTVSRWAQPQPQPHPGTDVSQASVSPKSIQGFSERKLCAVLQIDLFCRFTWARKFEFKSSEQKKKKEADALKTDKALLKPPSFPRLSDHDAGLSCWAASLCSCHACVKEPRNYLALDCKLHACRCLLCVGWASCWTADPSQDQ